MKAIRIERTGGPEVLTLADVAEPQPDDKSLLVDVRAAGVNFLDVYFRRGTYPMPLPWIPGDEAMGIVRAVGSKTSGFAVGDRVAWTVGKSAYAEVAVAPAATTARLPEDLPDEAGFILANGLTAHYLAHDIVPVGSGTTALVHAAAGGVGSVLTRILKLRGARVIATVSNDAKAQAARDAGADEVIVGPTAELPARVREWTQGAGVDVAYDGVGRDTVPASLKSVRVRGTLVNYGASSGPTEPIEPMLLARAGSIAFIRPGLMNYISKPDEFRTRIDALFGWLADGSLSVHIGGRYALADAADAHRALESRTSTGKLILLVPGTAA